jgi:BioD-like phosphotransacetylase family protein
MSVLLVASSEPRAGRSMVAAALAYRMARAGRSVTLARLAGDESAAPDAEAFASLEYLVSPGAPVAASDVPSLSGDVVAEAPPGDVGALAKELGASVVGVGGTASPELPAPADVLRGVILTRVPASEVGAVSGRSGLLAVLREDRLLASPSVTEIAGALNAEWLHESDERTAIERVMIGTVASDSATPYFANRERVCVLTRFDKTDIQLAALFADLSCMVLTGGGEPSPYLLDRVRNGREEVDVLLTQGTTVEAMRAIEPLFGRSRFGGMVKLERAVALLDEAGVPEEL